MRLRYYLINRKNKTAFEGLMRYCNRLYKQDYYKILRHCTKENGEVINAQFGELFADEHLKNLDNARESAQAYYKMLVGVVTEDGFFMADMSTVGIYSLSHLISLLRSNRNFIVEDENGIRITIQELKNIAKIKKVHLHYRETLNGQEARKFTVAKKYLTELRQSIEEKFNTEKMSSSRANELARLMESLNKALEILKEGIIE